MADPLNFAQFRDRVGKATVTIREEVEALRTVAGDIVFTNLTTGGAYSSGTPVDTGYALSRWARVRATVRGAIETFTNDCVYIRPLEYGHSSQAPFGFMRLTVLHWRDIVRDALRIVRRAGRPTGRR